MSTDLFQDLPVHKLTPGTINLGRQLERELDALHDQIEEFYCLVEEQLDESSICEVCGQILPGVDHD